MHKNSIPNWAATLGLVISVGSLAQEQPAQPQPETAPAAVAPVVTPARGATMDSVKEKFGAPSQEAPAVGQPPITRWEYPGYVVFFEHDRVLHTVIVNK
jgi:hypothetical protein